MKTVQNRLKIPHWSVAVAMVGLLLTGVKTGFEAESAEPAPPAAEAGSVAEPAAATASYLGSDACAACHQEVRDALQQSMHGAALSGAEAAGRGHQCEGCHGAGSLHAEDPTAANLSAALKERARSGAGCLSCHNTRVSPVGWQGSEHRRGEVLCLDCHGQPDQPHADLERRPSSDACVACHGEKRAQVEMPSHHPLREGRVACADCHDPHRAAGREMNREVCVSCHANRRGPFLFEHGAISGDLTEGCLDCHLPHGAPNARLLRLANRGLCLQCHADKGAHFPGTVCWDCHQGLHGSNSSPLLFTP